MFRKFIEAVDNEQYFFIITLVLLGIILFFSKSTMVGTSIFTYLLFGLLYFHYIRRTIKIAKSIILIILWLLIIPAFVALLPLALLEEFYKESLLESAIFTPLYIIFWVLTWFGAVFWFDFMKVRVAVQVINAVVLSILGITFLVYFYPGFLSTVLGDEIISELNNSNLGIESLVDYNIRLVTLPYFLSVVWANVAIEIRSYHMEKSKIKNREE